jgi:hypothetical protein
VRRLFPIALCVLAAAGCGTRSSAPPAPVTTTAKPTTVTAPPMTLTVYRVEDGKLRPHTVQRPRTRAVAAAALAALGVDGTVQIDGGTATVQTDGTPSDEQVAEIVYTLTQFPSVQRVDVGGRTGLTRDDVAAYVPPIVVDTPADGSRVGADFDVAGTASVFEATLVVRLVRDGAELSRQTVTAAEGAPGRGPFSTRVHATPGPLQVQVFSPSAVDGSPQHEVDVDVTVAG